MNHLEKHELLRVLKVASEHTELDMLLFASNTSGWQRSNVFMKKQKRILLVLMALATLIAIPAGCGRKPIKNEAATKVVGQRLHLKGYYRRFPWKQGGRQEAMTMALREQPIRSAADRVHDQCRDRAPEGNDRLDGIRSHDTEFL